MLNILPEPILKYLIDKLPPFTGILMIKTSDEGIVSGWYGNPTDYLDELPVEGADISEMIPALFGMIPPLVVPTVLSRIQTREECIADIHIAQDESTGEFWIFFVDQTKEVENIRQILQRLNESHLQAGKGYTGNPFGALHLLDYITFEKHKDGFFSLVGDIPDWFRDLTTEDVQPHIKVMLSEIFPFIDVFVIEAAEFWNNDLPGNLKSGIWTENTSVGKALYLNAYALNQNDFNYLIIKPLYQEFNDEQDLMQRAREQSLAFEKLAKAERKLKELLDYKDKFVSIVSHDLRSPVASVLSIAQVLNSDEVFLNQISDFNREMINHIQEEMIRLLDYNDKLYHWSNLELGNFEIIRSKVSIKELVTAAKRVAMPKLLDKKIEFISKVPDQIEVEVDKTLFSQVLNNLIGNAVKFTPDGGKITISAVDQGALIRLTIKDSGVGMSQEVASKLFEGFVHNSTQGTHGEKGTGLGMGIIKKIVDAHQIPIVVKSVMGKGSSFVMDLPKV
jgi:signal transduction histidine kinase